MTNRCPGPHAKHPYLIAHTPYLAPHTLLLLACAVLSLVSFGQTKSFYIVFVGNSITYGAGLKKPVAEAPPVHAIKWLQVRNPSWDFKFSNQGVSGATTVDFLPETKKLFPRVVQGAELYKKQKDATIVFSIILGTNDSAIEGPNGAPISPSNYERNIKIIIDSLLASFPGSIFVLHRPTWYSTNTYNRSKYLEEGLQRLQSYFPVLDNIVFSYKTSHPYQVFAGDRSAFDYFKNNSSRLFQQEKGNAGVFLLHPNEAGAKELGERWAKSLDSALSEL